MTVTWETAADWDANRSEQSMVHTSHADLNYYRDDTIVGGYDPDDIYQSSDLLAYWPFTQHRVQSTGTAYDLPNTQHTGRQLDVYPYSGPPHSISFNGDGTVMVLLGENEAMHTFDLATAYEPHTAKLRSSYTLPQNYANGAAFNSDGTKFYVSYRIDNIIYEYECSTPYDVATASPTGNSFTASSISSTNGLATNGDTSKLFIMDSGDDIVAEYHFGTNGDVTTLSLDSTFDVSGQNVGSSAVSFADGGTRMYVTGSSIDEYTLSTAYDISTASHSRAKSVNGTIHDIVWTDSGQHMYAAYQTYSFISQHTVTSDTIIPDISGNGHHLEWYGNELQASGLGPCGHRGMAFDGSTNYAQRSYTSAFATNTITISVWVSVDGDPSGWKPVIMVNSSENDSDGYTIQNDGGDAWEFKIQNGDSAFGGTSDSTAGLVHLVMTYDGSTIRGYQDGSEVGLTNSASPSFDANNPVVFCRRPVFDDRYAPYQIAEARIYGRAFSGAEVDELYSRGRTVEMKTSWKSEESTGHGDLRLLAEVYADAGATTSPSVSAYPREDTNSDGSWDNTATVNLDNGTNTYTVSGFSETAGTYDYSVYLDAITSSTDSKVKVHRFEVYLPVLVTESSTVVNAVGDMAQSDESTVASETPTTQADGSTATSNEHATTSETSTLNADGLLFSDSDVAVTTVSSFTAASATTTTSSETGSVAAAVGYVASVTTMVDEDEVAKAIEDAVRTSAYVKTEDVDPYTIASETGFVDVEAEMITSVLPPLYRVGVFGNDDSKIKNTNV